MLWFVFIFILFLSYKSIKRYNKFFNPFTLSIQIPLFFLTLPQLISLSLGTGKDSPLSDVVILLYVLAIYIGTSINTKTIFLKDVNNKKAIIAFTVLLSFFLLLPMFPMLLKYGISFKGLRNFYEKIVFSQFASFYETFKILITCTIVLLFVKYKKITFLLIVLIIILMFSGSKMAMLSTVIILANMYEEYKKINYWKMGVFLLLFFVFILYYHFIQSSQKEMGMAALSYFDIYKQQTKALNMLWENKMDYFYGEISLSAWYKVIPRIIWTDKPFNFGFALLNYEIYPEYASNGYMPSFGLAYSFADFGFLSVFVSGFFLGFFKNFFYKIFTTSNKNSISFILYALNIDIIICIILLFYYSISNLRFIPK